MLKSKAQTFNDGIVSVYKVSNVAEPGCMPVEKIVLKDKFRYHERTVGLARRNFGKQDNAEIKYVLRCPRRRDVSGLDVAIPNDGKQYRIWNVQYPEDVDPTVMDLTLEELSGIYDKDKTI